MWRLRALSEEGKRLLSYCASRRRRGVYQSEGASASLCKRAGCVCVEAESAAAVCEAPMYLCKNEESFQQTKFR
jgi:hypothetical protein